MFLAGVRYTIEAKADCDVSVFRGHNDSKQDNTRCEIIIEFSEYYGDCPADLDKDGYISGTDLALMLAAWGTIGADVTSDGDTSADDLAILLAQWGECIFEEEDDDRIHDAP